MFEEKTFESLMELAMQYAPEWADTSEGSVFYDVAAPLCMLLTEAYADLTILQNQMKIPTATGSWLDAKAEEYGLTREEAEPWVYALEYSGAELYAGERFFAEDHYYIIDAIGEDGTRYITCETTGTAVPKLAKGTAVVPVGTIDGLTSATVGDVFEYATDTETDEELRSRLQKALAQPSENANVAQVRKWAIDFEGVKSAKVYGRSTYNLSTDIMTNDVPNNVVIFINPDEGYGESALVDAFQRYIDPDAEGNGEGVGIIGTIYSVFAFVHTAISVSCTVYVKSSIYGDEPDEAEIKKAVLEKVNDYFDEIVEGAEGEYIYIYRDNVKAKIQTIEGLTNCENLTLSGYSKNLRLPAYKRPEVNADDITLVIEVEGTDTEETDDDFEEL